jgi:hypothetical protein
MRTAQHFDPYHEWLGIPPHEQPPTYYRLLGISPFEQSQAAIQNAADRQMAHLRTLAIGPRGHVSQALANDVAKAAGVLMDPYQKGQYDAWLASVYAAQQPEPEPVAPPAAVVRRQSPAPRRRYRPPPRTVGWSKGQLAFGWIVGGIIGIALGVMVVAVVWDVSPQDVLRRIQGVSAAN